MVTVRRGAVVQWTFIGHGRQSITRKFDFDHLIVTPISGWSPTAPLSCPAGQIIFCLFHSSLQTPCIKALLFFSLPLVISTGGSNEVNSILTGTLNKLRGLQHNSYR